MLVKIDYTGKEKSKYICDRCKAKLTDNKDKRYRIVVHDSSILKQLTKWDLCDRCYNALQRGIQKGKKEIQNE